MGPRNGDLALDHQHEGQECDSKRDLVNRDHDPVGRARIGQGVKDGEGGIDQHQAKGQAANDVIRGLDGVAVAQEIWTGLNACSRQEFGGRCAVRWVRAERSPCPILLESRQQGHEALFTVQPGSYPPGPEPTLHWLHSVSWICGPKVLRPVSRQISNPAPRTSPMTPKSGAILSYLGSRASKGQEETLERPGPPVFRQLVVLERSGHA